MVLLKQPCELRHAKMAVDLLDDDGIHTCPVLTRLYVFIRTHININPLPSQLAHGRSGSGELEWMEFAKALAHHEFDKLKYEKGGPR